MIKRNSYDIDGVLHLGEYSSFTPNKHDVIITGRSYEEAAHTLLWLNQRGIYNQVFFNPARFKAKNRVSSGIHKGLTLLALLDDGMDIGIHFEDDEIQIQEIKKLVGNRIQIVHIVHDLVEKENVWHGK